MPSIPAFRQFRCQIHAGAQRRTLEAKFDFWGHVAFANLLQRHVPQKAAPPYSENHCFYDAAISMLQQLLDEFQPQIVYVWEHIAYDAVTRHLPLLDGLQQKPVFPEHPTMEHFRFPGRKILPSHEGWRSQVLPIESVLVNDSRRGLITYSNGRLVISSEQSERVIGSLLYKLLHYYTFQGWDDLDILFVKYNRDGQPVIPARSATITTLRKISSTTNF